MKKNNILLYILLFVAMPVAYCLFYTSLTIIATGGKTLNIVLLIVSILAIAAMNVFVVKSVDKKKK